MKRAWEAIKEGATDMDLFEENPSVAFKYQRGIAAARNAAIRHRSGNTAPKIEIFWGPSGSGKTRRAFTENPGAYMLSKPNSDRVWWDGYIGQECIIIDEFYGWLPYDFMLRLLDRYPLNLEIKGGTIPCAATKFVITSNVEWTDWYSKVKDTSALRRRIEEFGSVEYIGYQHNDGQFEAMLEREVLE